MIQEQKYLPAQCYIQQTMIHTSTTCSTSNHHYSCSSTYRCEVYASYHDMNGYSHTGVAYSSYSGIYYSSYLSQLDYCNRYRVSNTYQCFYDPRSPAYLAMDTTWQPWKMTFLWVVVALNVFCPLASCVLAYLSTASSRVYSAQPFVPLQEVSPSSNYGPTTPNYAPVFPNYGPTPPNYAPVTPNYAPTGPNVQTAPGYIPVTYATGAYVSQNVSYLLGQLKGSSNDFDRLEILRRGTERGQFANSLSLPDAILILDCFQQDDYKQGTILVLYGCLQSKYDIEVLINHSNLPQYRRDFG